MMTSPLDAHFLLQTHSNTIQVVWWPAQKDGIDSLA